MKRNSGILFTINILKRKRKNPNVVLIPIKVTTYDTCLNRGPVIDLEFFYFFYFFLFSPKQNFQENTLSSKYADHNSASLHHSFIVHALYSNNKV